MRAQLTPRRLALGQERGIALIAALMIMLLMLALMIGFTRGHERPGTRIDKETRAYTARSRASRSWHDPQPVPVRWRRPREIADLATAAVDPRRDAVGRRGTARPTLIPADDVDDDPQRRSWPVQLIALKLYRRRRGRRCPAASTPDPRGVGGDPCRIQHVRRGPFVLRRRHVRSPGACTPTAIGSSGGGLLAKITDKVTAAGSHIRARMQNGLTRDRQL
jgi:hypothetical protein